MLLVAGSEDQREREGRYKKTKNNDMLAFTRWLVINYGFASGWDNVM